MTAGRSAAFEGSIAYINCDPSRYGMTGFSTWTALAVSPGADIMQTWTTVFWVAM